MIKRIVAYGDSITYGYDLPDCDDCPSNLTYAALVAKHYGLEYECRAVGSNANQSITRNLLDSEILSTDLVIIMWTFIDRKDFLFDGELGWRSISAYHVDQYAFASEYYRYIDTSLDHELYLTHKEIVIVQKYLEANHIPFLFLSATDTILKSLNWNNTNLSNLIDRSKWVIPFQEQGFYDWTKDQRLTVPKGGHPNELANRILADYIISQELISK
jgi:hypothetical protein